jgi:ribonuclease Y
VQTVVTVATLILLLLALLTVMFARRDAAQERLAARRDTELIREEARSLMSEAQRREERVAQREKDSLADQRNAQAYARALEERVAVVARDEKRLVAQRDQMRSEYEEKLAAVADLSPAEAREELKRALKDAVASEAARESRLVLRKAKDEAQARAREILVTAMQRQIGEAALQAAITRVELPSDEMKGRVIGREGRNIRAFEALTGVNVIVEEGVNAVQLSSFDVERREVAAVTLQALIDDGRIQPQRIELAYRQALEEAPQRATDAALDAAHDAGVRAIPAEVQSVLGQLRLRSSYGQNVLEHSVETALIAAEIARSIEADVETARRAAFFHDIGKAFTVEQQGSHAALGAAFMNDHGEGPVVVNAIAAHHDEVEQESVEAVIVQIADALSASRPGARREDTDGYIERVEALEAMVATRPEVAQVFAMAAGRELRVVVKPERVSDAAVAELARTIAEQIQKDFTFAGEIRVTVIRETRADSVAGQA